MSSIKNINPYRWVLDDSMNSKNEWKPMRGGVFEIEFMNIDDNLSTHGYPHPAHLILLNEEDSCQLRLSLVNTSDQEETLESLSIEFVGTLARSILQDLTLDKSNLGWSIKPEKGQRKNKIELIFGDADKGESLVFKPGKQLNITFSKMTLESKDIEHDRIQDLREEIHFNTRVNLSYSGGKSLNNLIKIAIFRHDKSLAVLNDVLNFETNQIYISAGEKKLNLNETINLSDEYNSITQNLTLKLSTKDGKEISVLSKSNTNLYLELKSGYNYSGIANKKDIPDIDINVHRERTFWDKHYSTEDQSTSWTLLPKMEGDIIVDYRKSLFLDISELISKSEEGEGIIRLDCNNIEGYNGTIFYLLIEKSIPEKQIMYFNAQNTLISRNENIHLSWLCVGSKEDQWELICEEHEELGAIFFDNKVDNHEIIVNDKSIFKSPKDALHFRLEPFVGDVEKKELKIRPKPLAITQFGSYNNKTFFTNENIQLTFSTTGYYTGACLFDLICDEAMKGISRTLFQDTFILDYGASKAQKELDYMNFSIELRPEDLQWKNPDLQSKKCVVGIKRIYPADTSYIIFADCANPNLYSAYFKIETKNLRQQELLELSKTFEINNFIDDSFKVDSEDISIEKDGDSTYLICEKTFLFNLDAVKEIMLSQKTDMMAYMYIVNCMDDDRFDKLVGGGAAYTFLGIARVKTQDVLTVSFLFDKEFLLHSDPYQFYFKTSKETGLDQLSSMSKMNRLSESGENTDYFTLRRNSNYDLELVTASVSTLFYYAIVDHDFPFSNKNLGRIYFRIHVNSIKNLTDYTAIAIYTNNGFDDKSMESPLLLIK